MEPSRPVRSLPRLVWALYAPCPPGIRLFAWARCLVFDFNRVLTLVPREGRIVDVGCGTGVFANLLALDSARRTVHGADLEPRVIAAARAAARQRENVSFATSDIGAALGAEPAPDVVTAIDLFHHLPPARQTDMIATIHRMLRRGGLFLLKDLDTSPLWKRWANWWHDAAVARGDPRIHVRSRHDYAALLTAAGFTVETVPLPQAYLAHVLFICRKA